MSGLAEALARRIAAVGPMTVAEYMAACLLDPAHGYYTTRQPFGAAGDFTTAPEISQMFGELCGLALAQAWADQGAPAPALLAEAGPGRGTLMADALRATAAVPGFADAAGVHLVEAAPALRDVQARTLGAGAARVRWHDRLEALPPGPLFLIANEFLDALPVRQFVRSGDGWCERVVGLRDGTLALGLTEPVPVAALAHRLRDTGEGAVVETNAAAEAVVAAVAARIVRDGGAAVFVDYGGGPSLGDTLQAVRGHASVDPLDAPGTADLTAHVDFVAMEAAARGAGARVARVAQGVWLERLGITGRAQALARGLRGAALDSHVAAHRRLTHPDEMGQLFQVLALTPPGAPPMAGTDTPVP